MDNKENKVEVDWGKKWWELDDVTTLWGRMKYWARVSDPKKAFVFDSTLLAYKQDLG